MLTALGCIILFMGGWVIGIIIGYDMGDKK